MGEDKIDINEKLSSEKLAEFLNQDGLQRITNEYDKVSKEQLSAGFNVFTMTSDVFYKENYHSDILKAFLDPEELHGEGSKFLDVFIDMLNSANRKNHKPLGVGDSSQRIDKKNYTHALVLREPERIDILIKGNEHLIIIENKINDARDMDRQLPRYYDALTKLNKGEETNEVDAIVYLTKYPAYPAEIEWKAGDRNNVYPRLINISLSEEFGKNSLIKSWVDICIKITSNIDCISILRQYIKLLKTLIPNAEKERCMKELLNFFYKNPEKFKYAKVISEMMKNLPSQMAKDLQNEINNRFYQNYSNVVFGQWPVWGPSNKVHSVITLPNEYSIFVICEVPDNYEQKAYTVCVKNFSNEWYMDNDIWLTNLELTKDSGSGRFYKCFGFSEEDKANVIDLIGELLKMFKKNGILD